MKHSDFRMHAEFTTLEGARRWRVTDIGSRVVVAIRVDEVTVRRSRLEGGKLVSLGTRVVRGAQARERGIFNGPPYGVREAVFDEYALAGCSPVA